MSKLVHPTVTLRGLPFAVGSDAASTVYPCFPHGCTFQNPTGRATVPCDSRNGRMAWQRIGGCDVQPVSRFA